MRATVEVKKEFSFSPLIVQDHHEAIGSPSQNILELVSTKNRSRRKESTEEWLLLEVFQPNQLSYPGFAVGRRSIRTRIEARPADAYRRSFHFDTNCKTTSIVSMELFTLRGIVLRWIPDTMFLGVRVPFRTFCGRPQSGVNADESGNVRYNG